MSVHEHLCFLARPFRRLGQIVPVLFIQQPGRDIHLLQLGAAAQKSARLKLGKVLNHSWRGSR